MVIIVIIIIFIIIIIIIIIVRSHFGSSPLDRCGQRIGASVCLTALSCESWRPRLLTRRLRGHAFRHCCASSSKQRCTACTAALQVAARSCTSAAVRYRAGDRRGQPVCIVRGMGPADPVAARHRRWSSSRPMPALWRHSIACNQCAPGDVAKELALEAPGARGHCQLIRLPLAPPAAVIVSSWYEPEADLVWRSDVRSALHYLRHP